MTYIYGFRGIEVLVETVSFKYDIMRVSNSIQIISSKHGNGVFGLLSPF